MTYKVPLNADGSINFEHVAQDLYLSMVETKATNAPRSLEIFRAVEDVTIERCEKVVNTYVSAIEDYPHFRNTEEKQTAEGSLSAAQDILNAILNLKGDK